MNVHKISCLAGITTLCVGSVCVAKPAVLGTLVPTGMVGDANGDGIANALDLSIVQTNLNKSGGLAQGDFDGNGLVNSADLTLLNNHYQRRQSPAYFGRVADSTTSYTGIGKFSLLDAPAIDKSGNLAFYASGTSVSGIYRWSYGGTVTKVADTGTAIPSGTGNFTFIGQPSISQGVVAFEGLGNSQDGLYTHALGAAASTMVLNKTSLSNKFLSFSDPDIRNGKIAFLGRESTGKGVHTVSGGTVSTLATAGSTYLSFSAASTNGPDGYYYGRMTTNGAIYKRSGTNTTLLLDKTMSINGTSSKFGTIGSISQDSGNITFTGTLGNNQGVYGIFGSLIRKIADNTTLMPDGNGEKFSNFGASAIGGNNVVFVGLDSHSQPGLYSWINGEVFKIIDTSNTLGGKLIYNLDLHANSLAGNRVAFAADFTDGTSGVFVATLPRTALPGDVNNDGSVDNKDYGIVMQNFGQKVGRNKGDLNADGIVSFADVQIVERNLNLTGVAPLLGDIDSDGLVNNDDFQTLFANFNKYGTAAQGDMNYDGRIDFKDYNLLQVQLGKTLLSSFQPFGAAAIPGEPVMADAVPSFALVPEPGIGALAGIAAIGLLRRRRK